MGIGIFELGIIIFGVGAILAIIVVLTKSQQ